MMLRQLYTNDLRDEHHGMRWLVRNLVGSHLWRRTPDLDGCSNFMNFDTIMHIKHTHVSIAMDEPFNTPFKKIRLPICTSDFVNDTVARENRHLLEHIDPCVRPLLPYFNGNLGYPTDNNVRCPSAPHSLREQCDIIQTTIGSWKIASKIVP